MTATDQGIRCMLMRGGSSKGAYFLAGDLPDNPAGRDDLLLRVMGSPDQREVDGIGGGHPLTSKVAVVRSSTDPAADVDYHFFQVVPDRATVTDAQTCGNLLAGVGPFAIERGLLTPSGALTEVRIRLMNPAVAYATARVQTPNGAVCYRGDTMMAGAPFPAAPVELSFPGREQGCFPTGHLTDAVTGLTVSCVDAGMPVVLVRADDLGLAGAEPVEVLEADKALRDRLEALRLAAGGVMGLGDVGGQTVPKVCLVSRPQHGGTLTTRTFIPHRVHAAIGVVAGVSVAVGAVTPGTVANQLAVPAAVVGLEHPSGTFEVRLQVEGAGANVRLRSSTVVRTARKLFDGLVWPRPDPSGGP